MYDQFGSDGPQGFGGQGGFGGSQGFDFNDLGGFADIFENFFGGQGGASARTKHNANNKRGEDLEVKINIDFKEAVFGADKKIKIRKIHKCTHCDASGAEPGSKIITCAQCNGEGQIKQVRRTMLGQIMTQAVCPTCNGAGQTPETPCSKCNGNKRLASDEEVSIKIPQGVHDGAIVRLRGKGNEGVGNGPDGDLYINVSVKPSKTFKREGFDIHTDLEINIIQAVLGDELEIETVHGKEALTIPPGTQNDKFFRFKAKGVPKLNSNEKGDHIVHIKVFVPKKISKKERDLYLQLAEESGIDVKPGKSGLLW
jgi:molecular chaperone DnaJ